MSDLVVCIREPVWVQVLVKVVVLFVKVDQYLHKVDYNEVLVTDENMGLCL